MKDLKTRHYPRNNKKSLESGKELKDTYTVDELEPDKFFTGIRKLESGKELKVNPLITISISIFPHWNPERN